MTAEADPGGVAAAIASEPRHHICMAQSARLAGSAARVSSERSSDAPDDAHRGGNEDSEIHHKLDTFAVNRHELAEDGTFAQIGCDSSHAARPSAVTGPDDPAAAALTTRVPGRVRARCARWRAGRAPSPLDPAADLQQPLVRFPTRSTSLWLKGFAHHQPMTPTIETMRWLLTEDIAVANVSAALARGVGILVVCCTLALRVYRRGAPVSAAQ